MNNTCITIDVSQGKSHIQGFLGLNRPIGKPKIMRHTKHGYLQLIELLQLIQNLSNEIPLVIFEYTGIYHKSLEKFLLKKEIKYHIVSPLRAAKSRKNDLRSVKTDKRDCSSIAKMFYNDNLGQFTVESKEYEELKHLNRFYEKNNHHMQEYKVSFRECLATIYPNYKITKANDIGAFKSIYSDISFRFLSNFPHPEIFLNTPEDEVITKMNYTSKRKPNFDSTEYKRLYDYVDSLVSGVSIDSYKVESLKYYLNEITSLQKVLDETIEEMVKLAKETYLYDLIISIPCIQKNLAARFIAELGDITRFKSYKAIIAIAGTDPIIYQSGDNNGFHLKISKKGNKHLRTILYLMVNQLIKAANIDSPIKDFYKKKTQQGLPKLAACVACCNKLLRIIYYMNKTGSAFSIEH